MKGQKALHPIPKGARASRPWRDDEGVSVGSDVAAELVEEELHRRGGGVRQNQAAGGVALGAGGAEQLDRLMTLVLEAGGARAFLVPASTIAPGLADSCLVLQPHFDALGLGMRGLRLGNQAAEFFLKSSCARRAALGCPGRVFCQERSIPCRSSSMPFSL